MQIRLTVFGARNAGPGTDVLVTAPSGTRFQAVATALRTASGAPGHRYWAGETLLDQDSLLGHPPLIDGALVTADAPGAATVNGSTPELRVVGGPDAGGVHLLSDGAVRIGRAAEAEVRLADPDLSRLHAELTIDGERLTVADLGSTNGTTVDGVPVGRAPVELPSGSLLRAGESTLTVVLPHPRPDTSEHSRGRADGHGHIELPRPRRALRPAAFPEVTVELPPAPPPRRALALRRKTAESARGAAEEQGRKALLEEVLRRRELSPDAASLLLLALDAGSTGPVYNDPGVRLWERHRAHPDLLSVRLGIGDVPSHVTLVDPDTGPRRMTAYGVPVEIPLREHNLGLAGPRSRTLGLVRSLVAQTAALQSPQEVEFVLLCGDDSAAPDWAWLRWLPHLRPAEGQDCRLLLGLSQDQADQRIAELTARLETPSPSGRRTLVILDGAAALATRPDVARLLTHGPAAGIHTVALDENTEDLPRGCALTAVVTGDVNTRLRLTGPGGRIDEIVADAVSAAWADRFARALAPLRETAGRAAAPLRTLPEEVRLLDQLDLDLLTPAKLRDRWQREPAGARIVLGADARGPVAVDLATEFTGPAEGAHVVIGGADGSGRSELLTGALCSLAVTNRPDELGIALLLGAGAATGAGPFGCAELPHLVGFLDTPEASRIAKALTAVRAELDRREALLRGETFTAYPHPLPRLVVAVDDLDRLVDTCPEAADHIAELTQYGGPLGVHVIATTGGGALGAVAGAEIRIALRTDDQQSSRALIDVDDAAALGERWVGRGLVRGADGAVVPFQGGRITGRMPRTATLRPTVVRQEWTDMGDALARRTTGATVRNSSQAANGPTDLALLTGAVRRAAEQSGVTAPAKLWEWDAALR